MFSTLRPLLAAALTAASAAIVAQPASPPVAAAVSAPASAAGSAPVAAPVSAPASAPVPAQIAEQSASPAGPAASAARSAEPASTVRVIEDDRVRIEETRIRGQVQRVVVRSKLTGQDYEIIVGPGGRDPSQKSDAAGQRAWSLFRF